jgi:hypothetical protein
LLSDREDMGETIDIASRELRGGAVIFVDFPSSLDF